MTETSAPAAFGEAHAPNLATVCRIVAIVGAAQLETSESLTGARSSEATTEMASLENGRAA